MIVKTANGSIYELDTDKKVWCRATKGQAAGTIRRDGEWLPYISFHGSVGEGLTIIMEPLPESVDGTINRVVYTSDIMEVQHDDASQD